MKGRVAKVFTETGNKKDGSGQWKRVSLVIDTADQYNPHVCFGTTPKCGDFVETLQVGQEVSVDYNLSSREYNDKWYTQATAWKVTAEAGTPSPTYSAGGDGNLSF